MSRMMSRIELSSPPGVSRRRTTSGAPSFAARARLRPTKSAVAGPMAPSTDTSATGAGAACGDASKKAASTNRRRTAMAGL